MSERISITRALMAAAVGLATLASGCGGGKAPAPQPEPAVVTITPAELERSAMRTLDLHTGPERSTVVAVGPIVESLEPMVREALRPRMNRHARDLTDLYGALHAGQRTEMARLATAIADEPQIAPSGPPDSANANIPAAFVEQQSALVERARAVAEAAEGADDAALARALEGLADGCAGCHTPR